MLFHIFIGFILFSILYAIYAFGFYEYKNGKIDKSFNAAVLLLISAFPIGITLGVISTHANNLAKVNHQAPIIAVYEQNIADLEKRLDKFDYPSGSLLNADSPVASITKSLTDAQTKLAAVKEEQAIAMRKIESRRLGVMSGVIRWVGDYK